MRRTPRHGWLGQSAGVIASSDAAPPRVSVIGTGYVGLVTGACLAELGQHVICVDMDEERVAMVRRGESPIHEVGLPELLARHVGRRLDATTDLRWAVQSTDVTLITVGTPFADNQIDLRFVRQAAAQIGRALRTKASYHVVAVKSTVVPGTTDETVLPIIERESGRRAGSDFGVGVNPEFLTEGQAVRDFLDPDRIVIGAIDDRTTERLTGLYRAFESATWIRTNNPTAEMIKYASNALLATAISFANEIGNLCSAVGGVDVVDVMKGVHASDYLSPRINGERVTAPIASFLWAGCGFGGSCLPKDVSALAAHGRQRGSPMSLLDAVLRVNERQHEQVLARLRKHFPSLRGVRVTVLGLAFKPDTDDMRESPAIPIVRELIAEGADVRAYDPAVDARTAARMRGVEIARYETLEPAVREAQAIVLVTRWDEFQRVTDLLLDIDAPPLVVDGRRMLDRSRVARYEGIGL